MRKLIWVLTAVAMMLAGTAGSSFADDQFKSIDYPTEGGIQGRADVYESGRFW